MNPNETPPDKILLGLPEPAQVYLDVWAMGITPEGKRMTVRTAAELAGVTVSAVKNWRRRYSWFSNLEKHARNYSAGYARRLSRKSAERLVLAAGRAIRRALAEGDGRLGWDILKSLGRYADQVEVGPRTYTADMLAGEMEQARAELEEWQSQEDDEQELAGMGAVEAGEGEPSGKSPED